MPTRVSFASVAAMSGRRVVVCGGYQGSVSSASDQCFMIRPGWGGWKKSAAMSQKRARSAFYTNGDILIVAGGTDENGGMTDSVEKYDGSAWGSLTSLTQSTEGLLCI